jgi:hypothetical protein
VYEKSCRSQLIRLKLNILFSAPKINLDNINIVYDANDPNELQNPNLITPLERYHNNHADKNCRQYKLLGIYLDEFLTFDAHVEHLCNKINRSLYCIKQAKNNLSLSALKTLYYALDHSHLTYCPIILSCTSKGNINQISKAQKKTIRIIRKSTYNEHTAELFSRLDVQPYDKILDHSKLMFMHSIEYKHAPKAFNNTWQRTLNVILVMFYVMKMNIFCPTLDLNNSKGYLCTHYPQLGM